MNRLPRLSPHNSSQSPAPLLCAFPLDNVLVKSDQEHRLARPHAPLLPGVMRTDCRVTTDPTANTFDYPGHVRGAVQLRHLLWHTDILINQGLVVTDHVFIVIRAGGLNGVGGSGKKVPPESVGDEL